MECSLITRIGLGCSMLMNCEGNTSLMVDTPPATVIGDAGFELVRPEGVAFSPSGEYVAVANASVNKVTFYKRIGDHGSAYEKKGAFCIEGARSSLDYPHDIA